MKGKYNITVKSRRIQYKFTVLRNITILRGDSATGKTTLIDMIAAYQETAKQAALRCRVKTVYGAYRHTLAGKPCDDT